MADPTMGADPTAAADPSQDEPAGGFSVTVTDNGDGTYSVSSSDSDAQEDGESNAGPQTAQSLDEACQMMEQMFQQESGEDSSEDGNAPLPSKEAAQAAWNQMASKRDKARSM